MFITKFIHAVAIVIAIAALGMGAAAPAQRAQADFSPTRDAGRQDIAGRIFDAQQDVKEEAMFSALIKSVKDNKVTLNRSDKDNKFNDEVLTAVEKVVVKLGKKTAEDGLKNAAFNKMVRARITVDTKNQITEIRVGGGFFNP